MRLRKFVHKPDPDRDGCTLHVWRVSMRGTKGELAASVGVSGQYLSSEADRARSFLAEELTRVRRDIRMAYETTSPPWASKR